MWRAIRPTIARAQRENIISQGRRGAVPEGTDVELADRTRRGLMERQRWDTYKKGFKEIKAKIRGVYLGNNGPWHNQPLFAIEVMPLQKLPTTQPPNTATLYHISVAFYDPAKRRDFETLHLRYSRTRTIVLKGEIRGGTFEITKGPIYKDTLLRKLHSEGHYGDRSLHISL